MKDLFNQFKDRVLAFYNGLDRNRKIVLYVSIAVLVFASTFGILYLTRTEYVVIAQGLAPAEAQSVTIRLDDMGIVWRDSANTSVISVAAKDASRARMEIAAEMQASNFSWNDVFSSESITMTSQTREQMIIQATAGAVERSIETLTAVENATVILQIPKESNYFIKDEIKSKASAVLSIKRGTTLSEEQVSGIVNLIVSSVKDLSPENVTVLDTSGIQLNNPNQGNGFNVNSQYDLQYRVQNQMQYDLTSFLEKLYGAGNVEVKPNVILDFNQESETQRMFSPPIEGEISGMVRSATSITENVINSTGAVGVPGTDANAGDATAYTEGDQGASTYEKASETLNYELNELYREIITSQGDIQSLSIGVLLNSSALIDGEMTVEHRNELVDLIAMSAGTARENIRVMVQEFPDPMEFYDIYTGAPTEGLLFGIPIWAVVIIVLVTLVAVVAVMLILKRRKAKAEIEALELERQKEIKEKIDLEEIEGIHEDKGSPKYHIEKFVDNNPEAAATLLRAWLNDL
jgi:flagellar M-ring protein FliF